MQLALSTRIGLSLLSGIGVGLIQVKDGLFDFAGGFLAFYGISGALFAAAVLFPYLKRDDRAVIRALILVVASGVSYYAAVWLALDGPFSNGDGWISFVIASVSGAAIVLIAFALAIPARASREYVLYGLVAGLIGGPITYLTLPKEHIGMIATGHVIWHAMICLAIYFGTGNERQSDPF
jgi:fluoride ion exporter CrcB/FEX